MSERVSGANGEFFVAGGSGEFGDSYQFEPYAPNQLCLLPEYNLSTMSRDKIDQVTRIS